MTFVRVEGHEVAAEQAERFLRDRALVASAIEKLLAQKDEEEKEEPAKAETEKKQAMNYLTEMEISLHETLSRKVKINSKDGKKGTITIDFFDPDDLSDIASKLTT